MALATLTKGLIGIVLPGLILAVFVAIRGEWRRLSEWRIAAGAALFLLIGAPWFLLVALATGGQWLKEFIVLHHFQRYAGALRHGEPFYYYLANFPLDFLPWTVFAIPALYMARRDFWLLREPVPWCFFRWFTVMFFFFNLSESKRSLYLLPAFPPAIFFVARYFDRLIEGHLSQSGLHRLLAYGFFGVVGLTGLSLPAAAWFFRRELLWLSIPSSFLLVGGVWITLFSVRRQLPLLTLFSTVLTVCVTMVYTAGWILPAIDRYKSPRAFALQVHRIVPPDSPLFIYADTMNDFNFYLERELVPVLSSREELQRAVARADKIYLMIREKDFQKVVGADEPQILAEASVGGKTWRLAAWTKEKVL
jgi:4-amino-4-deoxy-L-arabinose transferase-like glycosyltransferase